MEPFLLGVHGSASFAGTSPGEYMRLAANVNSMTAPGMQPWHLRASYRETGTDDGPKGGTLEIWWAGPKSWKTSYAGNDFTQT